MHDRASLSRHLEASALATEAFFRAIPSSDFDRPVYSDGAAWTLRELLAHLAGIERSMHWLFANLLAGGEGSPADFDLERYNRSQPAKLAGQSTDELLARYRRGRQVTLSILSSMRDAELHIRGRHAYHGQGRLGDFIAWAGIHESLHLADAAAALTGPRAPSSTRAELPPICTPDAPWRRRVELRRDLAAFLPADSTESEHRRSMIQLTESLADPFSRDHFDPGHFTASAFVLAPTRDDCPQASRDPFAELQHRASISGPSNGSQFDGSRSNDDLRLLLIHHGKLDRWLQPGGHIDPSDVDVISAARREVAEETGLTHLEVLSLSPFDLDVHQIPAFGEASPHLHLDVRYLFRARTTELAPASDAKGAVWRRLDQVDVEHSDESVIRAVRKLLADGGPPDPR